MDRIIYIGFLKGYGKNEVLLYEDGGQIFECSTNVKIPEKLIEKILLAPQDALNTYNGYSKEQFLKVLADLKDAQQPEFVRELSDLKLKLLLRTHIVYCVYLRMIDENRFNENFKRNDKNNVTDDSYSLFKYNEPLIPIMVYRSIDGKFRELLTGITITSIETENAEYETNHSLVQLGDSHAAFINVAELKMVSEIEVKEYQENHPYKKIFVKQLNAIFSKATESYDNVVENMLGKRKRKTLE